MNREPDCFEIQNRTSEALDGLLSPALNHAFERHVADCENCRTKTERLRELLRVLHQQNRTSLPLELREDPFAFPARRIRRFFEDPKTTWKRLPVPIRLLIEGLSIAGVVVLGIRLGPVAREMYEARMEKRLQKMIAAEDLSARDVPLARGRNDTEDAEITDEVATGDGDSSGASVESDIRVGKGEIWRFNLKTDAPALVRTQILKTLKDVGIPENTQGIGGVEAPGGIQFDLLVPQSVIPQLKVHLEKLAGTPSANLPFSETFTWYKNRSKKPIPNGTSRVVIWLSQI